MAKMPDPSAAPRRRRIDLPGRGGAVAALEFGPQDRPIDVVFSHANGFNALTYRTILGPAAETRRILAYDLRGHGSTELPTVVEGRDGWNDLGEDLAALLEALNVHDVLLAGHSMGATSSLLAAAQAPERVRALALFEPVILEPGASGASDHSEMVQMTLRRRARFPSREAAVAAYLGRGAMRTWTRDMVADYVEGGLRPLPDGAFALACAPEWEASNYRSMSHDPWAAIARIGQPMRMLKAERHSTAHIDDAKERLTADGRISIETVPKTSHFLPMERPDLVVATLAALDA